jgi:hypothetical protein
MKNLFTIVAMLIIFNVSAQDSLKVMHYNLLNFGNFTDYCTFNNNNPTSKTAWLKTIIDYYLPDVFTVNEISPDSYYHQLILDEVMNSSGRFSYKKSVPTNNANSDIINLLYYNSEKLGLASQDVIFTSVRDINVYKLFYLGSNIKSQDTIFLYCIVGHLKAGTTTNDQNQRGEMAAQVMNYLASKNITSHCLLMGDFNLQNSSEPAWTNFTSSSNPSYNFSDPAGMVGNWHANQYYAAVHTQSTHTASNGCAAAGGVDDRFDFILTNQALDEPSAKIKYFPGSFSIPGQDGLRFNGSVLDPPNNSAPLAVLNALYEMSDHLPVTIKLMVETTTVLPCGELFFSEYVEGTGNNKALEIFNSSENVVNLSDYQLARYPNGNSIPDLIGLSGYLAPKKTYVVVLDKRDPNGTGTELPVDTALMAVADTFLCSNYSVNQTMYFNGNDAMSLQKTNGQIVDLIGKIGENPGVGWTADSLCTAGPFTDNCGAPGLTINHTLVRKHHVRLGLNFNPGNFNVTIGWDILPVNTFDHLGFHQSDCTMELPVSWNFIETMISHIIIIPLSVQPKLNGLLLKPGDYIGAFYLDGFIERCAGFAAWTGNSNTAMVVYGDDFLSDEKDGFYENENLILKVYSFSDFQDYYADADYNRNFPDNDGKFSSFDFSEILIFEAFTLQEQIINLPAGWSGLSSFLKPKWKEIEKLLGSDSLKVNYLSDGIRIYCPQFNHHSLIDWDSNDGFIVKVSMPFQLKVQGIPDNSKSVNLVPGWNLVPVKNELPVNVNVILNALGSNLVQIKEVAGTLIFWPEKEIATLQFLSPGKAYFIRVIENCNLNFDNEK